MFFFCMIWIMASIFLFLSHPLSLGAILLLQTVLIASLTGTLMISFWFSYILFLIMIGGMLILFIYMISIASNEKFKFSTMLFIKIIILITLSILISFLDKFYSSFFMNIKSMMNLDLNFNLNLSFNKFMSFPNNFSIYLMILYLLVTLIMVVKITDIQFGPLRQKF